MKDLIAKLQIDANCALGAIWMHIDAQAARIAELEAQIAAKPADTDKLREAIMALKSDADYSDVREQVAYDHGFEYGLIAAADLIDTLMEAK